MNTDKIKKIAQSYIGMLPKDKGCTSWAEMQEKMAGEINEAISLQRQTELEEAGKELMDEQEFNARVLQRCHLAKNVEEAITAIKIEIDLMRSQACKVIAKLNDELTQAKDWLDAMATASVLKEADLEGKIKSLKGVKEGEFSLELLKWVEENTLLGSGGIEIIYVTNLKVKIQSLQSKKVEFELCYCDKCVQMTNHLNGICQKCKPKEDTEEEWISVKVRMPAEGQIVDVWEMPDTQTQNNIEGLENTHHKSQYTGWRSTNYKYSFKKEKDGETYHSFEKVRDAYMIVRAYPEYKQLIVENGQVTHWKSLPANPKP